MTEMVRLEPYLCQKPANKNQVCDSTVHISPPFVIYFDDEV